MKLVDYTDEDLALSIAMETDPIVMAELGGPRPIESIEKVHPRRVSPTADGGMWLNIVPDDESEPAGSIGVWWGSGRARSSGRWAGCCCRNSTVAGSAARRSGC